MCMFKIVWDSYMRDLHRNGELHSFVPNDIWCQQNTALPILWNSFGYFIPNRPYWRYIGPICNIQDLICEVQWFSCILCMGLIVKFRDLLLIFNSANKINIIQRTLSSFQKVESCGSGRGLLAIYSFDLPPSLSLGPDMFHIWYEVSVDQ